MTLKETLDLIKYNITELDLQVCYNNEFDEECTSWITFVEETKHIKNTKKNKTDYWGSKVKTFNYSIDIDKNLERYLDFEVSMLLAKGDRHMFIFASNFH